MAKNLLVISCDVRETRVALIEDGIIAELHIERRGPHGNTSTVGNVYLGKVTRVLPGLQAAFIDIGQERAAFLHVEDLIRPDDFEGYLAGGKKFSAKQEDHVEEIATGDEELDAEKEAELIATVPELAAALAEDASLAALPSDPELHDADADADADEHVPAPAASAPSLISEDEDEQEDEDEDEDDELAAAAADAVAAEHRAHPLPEIAAAAESHEQEEERRSSAPPPPAPSTAPQLESRASLTGLDEVSEDADDADEEAHVEESSMPPSPIAAAAAKLAPLPEWPDMPGFTITDPNAPAKRAVAPSDRGDRGGGDRNAGNRGRRRRGRGRGREGTEAQPSRGGREPGERGAISGGGSSTGSSSREGREGGGQSREGRQSNRRDGRSNRDRGDRPMSASRISKSTPIKDVVREGQEVVVQVTKEPLGTKGARCTSHVSLPGRYVVYLPTVEHVGISKRIGSEQERARLREAIQSVKPPTGGLIVRTVAEGLTKKQLKQDVGYLVRLWGEIAKKKSENSKAPALLAGELDLVLKTARDLFTDEVDQIVIDDRREYDRLTRFVEMFAPDRLKDVVYYSGDEPIFDAYGIEDEIQRALSRKVPLPSGGHLIIDQAEALTAIDVNTGRFVGKGSKDMEDTILKTNLEAVHEIAYQLRFRNIGGLIILDLIDMEKANNREKVRRALEDILQKDKAKTSLNRISDLGLIEMTRKRTRESLGRLLHEPCFYCDGTGQLMSKETIAYEILREIRRKKADLPGYSVVVNCHPAVADLLQGSEKGAVADAENKYMRKIHVFPRGEYHYEQFDIAGK